MRPKPLIPTRTVMSSLPLGSRADLCQQTGQRLRQFGRAVDQGVLTGQGNVVHRRHPSRRCAMPWMLSHTTTSTATSCLARAATWAATS